MLAAVFELARPLLYALDPEQAHELTLKSLEAGIYPRPAAPDDPRLSVSVWGLDFPNPLGIAAGFDKDARVPDAMLGMGFGYAEIGTVTPRPQAGNPRPRVFRLMQDRALINRLGFNNSGHAAALERLNRRQPAGVVGVNVGANKDATDRAADYVAGVRTFYDVASYFTVNVSSPNTPGLRDLQAPAALDELVGRVLQAREEMIAAGKPQTAGGGQARARHCRGRSRAHRQGTRSARRRRHCGVELDAGTRAAARYGARQGGGRHLRTAAVPPLDRGAGPCPCADRRAHSTDRYRRHRFRRRRPLPSSKPAPRCCSFIRAWSMRDRGCSVASSRKWPPICGARSSLASAI